MLFRSIIASEVIELNDTQTVAREGAPLPAQKELIVKRDLEVKIGSTIYSKIQTARMSERERQVALNAMRDADLVVNAIVWLVKKIEHLGERLFLKPSLRH
jgi:hypothetical protein